MGAVKYLKTTYKDRFATIPFNCIFDKKIEYICPMNYDCSKYYLISREDLYDKFKSKLIHPIRKSKFSKTQFFIERDYSKHYNNIINKEDDK